MVSHLQKYPGRAVEIQGIRHTYQQLQLYLNDSEWITDTILNGFLSIFQSRNRVENVHICSSFEFCKIERNQNLDHLVAKLCSFHCLLMPICIRKHWLVAQFYPFCNQLDVYDSLYDGNEYLVSVFRRFWETVRNIKGWKNDLVISFKSTPKQPDGDSCGLYCISFIKSLQTGLPFLDLSGDLRSIRENILYTLLETHLESQ